MTERPTDDRRTYWPRVGPVGFVPDLGDDRPCANCGYNLRGLPFDAACPECGALYGISPATEALPWDDSERRGVIAFVVTVLIVLLRPRDLGGQIWATEPIDGKAAIAFRRFCIVIGAVCLSIVAIALTIEAIGFAAAMLCVVVDVAAIGLWLNTLTHGSIHFFEDKGAGSARRRAMALARYVAGPLALSPAHFALWPLHRGALEDVFRAGTAAPGAVLALMAAHLAILAVQLWACASAQGALLWQVVNVSRPMASLLAAWDVFARTLLGAIYFLGLPVLIALVANSLGQ